MIKIKLSELLGKRRMTQQQLSQLTGIRPNTISDIYNEICSRLSIDHLDRICEALECDISELIEYIPNKIKKTGDNLILEPHGSRKPNKHG